MEKIILCGNILAQDPSSKEREFFRRLKLLLETIVDVPVEIWNPSVYDLMDLYRGYPCVDYKVNQYLLAAQWRGGFNVDWVQHHFPDCLFISFDAPPSVAFKHHVRIRLSPYRWMAQYVYDVTPALGLGRDYDWILEEALAFRDQLPFDPGCPRTLFVPFQVEGDWALIGQDPGPRWFTHLDLADLVADLADDYDRVWFKHHPVRRQKHWQEALLDAVPWATEMPANPYRMFAMGEVHDVFGISSSLIEEAKAFGVNAMAMIQRDARHGKAGFLKEQELLSKDFWKAQCAGVLKEAA